MFRKFLYRLYKHQFWMYTGLESIGFGVVLYRTDDIDSHLNLIFHHIGDDWFDVLLIVIGSLLILSFLTGRLSFIRSPVIIATASFWIYMSTTFYMVAVDTTIRATTTPWLLFVVCTVLTWRILTNSLKFNPATGQEGDFND